MYTVLWTQFYTPCDVYTRAIIPCYANSAITPVLCMEIVLGIQYFIPGVMHLEYLRSAMYTILYIWNYGYSTTCVQCSTTYLKLDTHIQVQSTMVTLLWTQSVLGCHHVLLLCTQELYIGCYIYSMLSMYPELCTCTRCYVHSVMY